MCGRKEQARKLQDETLDTLRTKWGEDHPKTLYAKLRVAAVLDNADDVASRTLLQEVLRTQREIYGPIHPVTIRTIDELTVQSANAGDFEYAMTLISETHEMLKRDLSETHPRTQAVAGRRISLLFRQNQAKEGFKLANEIYDTSRAIHGLQHANTLMATKKMAQLLRDEKRYDEAIPMYRDAVAAAREIHGPNHLQTGNVLGHLGYCLLQLERNEEAKKAYDSALRIFRGTVGEEHSSSTGALNNLSVICIRLGDYETARDNLEELVDTSRRVFGPKGVPTIASLEWLAEAQEQLGQRGKAASIKQEVGEARYEKEEWHQAGDAFAKAAEIADDPNSQATSHLWAAMAYWQEAVHATRIRSRNQWWQAREHYDQAMSTIGDMVRSPELEELRKRAAEMISHQEARRCLKSLSAQIDGAPDDPKLLQFRARLLSVEKSWDEAAADWTAVIRYAGTASQRKQIAREIARWPEVSDRVAANLPDEANLWIARAQDHALHNRWQDAAEDYAKAKAADSVGDALFEYAGALLLTDDRDGYEQICRDILQGDEPDSAFDAYVLARTCAVGPSRHADPKNVESWARDALSINSAYVWHALGLAQYRAGLYQQALQSLQKSNSLDWRQLSKAQNWLVLAMTYRRFGDEELAVAAWQKAEGILTTDGPKRFKIDMPAPDWIALHLLRREAEALFDQDQSAKRQETQKITTAIAFLTPSILHRPWRDGIGSVVETEAKNQ